MLRNENFKFLLTRRINQDALENFFGTVRRQSGCCVNPKPIQFQRAFKKLFTLRFLNSGNENCRDDFGQILLQLQDFNNKSVLQTLPENDSACKESCSHTPLSTQDCDYRYQDVEKNSVRYICGYLIKKCLNIHSCDICKNFAYEHQELDETSLLSYFKAYETQDNTTYGNLCMPQNDLFIHVCELEQIFKENFKKVILNENVIGSLITHYKKSVFIHPCSNFPYNFFIKLYSRMRLFYTIKEINRNFNTVCREGQKHTGK